MRLDGLLSLVWKRLQEDPSAKEHRRLPCVSVGREEMKGPEQAEASWVPVGT